MSPLRADGEALLVSRLLLDTSSLRPDGETLLELRLSLELSSEECFRVEPSSSSLLFLAASPERVDGDLLLLLDLEEDFSFSLVMVNGDLLGLLDREGDLLAASPDIVNGDLLLRLLDREGDLAASPETVDNVMLL